MKLSESRSTKSEGFPIQVISFYKFFPSTEDQVRTLENSIKQLSESIGFLGLCILGTEGINTTLSIAKEKADELKAQLVALLNRGPLTFKDSFTPKHPFHKMTIKIRNEIVTIDRPDLVPNAEKHHHLSPEEWERSMNEEDVVVIDTRNSYEYDIGHFKNSVDPKIEEFTEFPKWVKNSGIPKDKKVLIYCTGGIRCEKAILDMEEQGYKNVYQLDGGILNYLAQRPHRNYEGECFVFDYRVAVDQELMPTKTYRLCPHCGQPAKEKIDCIQCGVSEIVCAQCLSQDRQFHTCSKNCAHHFRMGHKTKRIHKESFLKRGGAELPVTE